MEKLKFKTLVKHQDISDFLDKIEHHSGVRLPIEYVKRSKVVGAFLHDQLVATYMLVTSPGYRSMLFVPDAVKDKNGFFSQDSFDMLEVNGLWISPALKTPYLQMCVWAKLIKDIFLCKRKYVLLMRSKRNRSMEKFLGMANPELLYEGEPLPMAGEKTHEVIQVSRTTRWSIVANTPKYALEFYRRMKRAEQYSRHHLPENA